MKKTFHSNIKHNQNIEKLLDILICPKTGSSLKYDKENKELISSKANLAYPIKDNIPILIEKLARKIIKK